MIKTWLLTSVLALAPLSELRGAIPYAYLNGVPLWAAALVATAINACIPFLGFFFFRHLHKFFLKMNWYRRYFEKQAAKSERKVKEKIQKYGLWGLMVFVGIPLPMTGAWTGVIGAFILGLDEKKSTLSIILGVLIAGCIVTAVLYTGSSVASLFTKTINI